MNVRFEKGLAWSPPWDTETVTVIDAHTEGEPLRVIIDGFPPVIGDSVLERRRYARERLDRYRTALMFEPRGHADMYGCLVLSPIHPEADFSVLFLHNEGYSTMCGHGILAVTKVVLETGMVEGSDGDIALDIDTPAGQVTAIGRMKDGRVMSVRFINVASWVDSLDDQVDVPGLGSISYDLAFGGAYYAYVDAGALGLSLGTSHARFLINVGRRIKQAIEMSRMIVHPVDPELGFLYGVIFTDRALAAGMHSRQVCIFADGELDRSPTGTGVSGRAAILHARRQLGVGEQIRIESILGTTFGVRIMKTTRLGRFDAVVPEVEGHAWITGRSTFWLDPDDPLRDGFLIR